MVDSGNLGMIKCSGILMRASSSEGPEAIGAFNISGENVETRILKGRRTRPLESCGRISAMGREIFGGREVEASCRFLRVFSGRRSRISLVGKSMNSGVFAGGVACKMASGRIAMTVGGGAGASALRMTLTLGLKTAD